MTDVYPAVVQSLRTLLNDNDLIDAVCAGCGDGVADVLRRRLETDTVPQNALGVLRDVLHSIQSAISEAENAADDLETAIERSESA